MQPYNAPGVYIETKDNGIDRPIVGVSTSVTGFMAVTSKGPIGTPVRVTSSAGAVKAFGPAVQENPWWYVLDGFFTNGGSEAWISRVAHYTDPADTATLLAATAAFTQTGVGLAARAEVTGGTDVSNGVPVVPGAKIVIDTNNGGTKTATFNATPAVLDGAGGTFAAGDAGSATVTIDGVAHFVDLTAYAGAATVAGYITALNALIPGAFVGDDGGGQLRITTDTKGSGSSIVVSGAAGNWAAKTGITDGSGSNAGPNNVANNLLVTDAEFKAVIEGAIQTAADGDLVTVSMGPTGRLNFVESDPAQAAGPTSEIDIDATSTASLLTAIGHAVGVTVGSASTAASTLKLWAGYKGSKSPGTWSNRLTVDIQMNPMFPGQGPALDLLGDALASDTSITMQTSKGLSEGSIIRLSDGTNVEYVRIQAPSKSFAGGVVTHTVDLDTALANPFTAALTTITSMEFDVTVYNGTLKVDEFKQLTMESDQDNYAVAVINDPIVGSSYLFAEDLAAAFPDNILTTSSGQQLLAGGTSETSGLVIGDLVGNSDAKTGLYAFDAVDSLNLFAIVQSANSGSLIQTSGPLQQQMTAYAEGRADCFALLDTLPAKTPLQAQAFRNNLLGVDTSWGAMYYPHINVSDPYGTGKNAELTVTPLGHIAGLYSRVDGIPTPEGGVATAPAGVGSFGKLKGVLSLAYDVSEADQAILNPDGVNCLRNFTTGSLPEGVVVFGARTLSTNPKWRYIQVRRLMTFINQSIARGMRWAVFRNNNSSTWSLVVDRADEFLSPLWSQGQLVGDSKHQAFFIVCDGSTTTAEDVEGGRLRARIGVAPVRPAEFLIFEISQNQAGASINEV